MGMSPLSEGGMEISPCWRRNGNLSLAVDRETHVDLTISIMLWPGKVSVVLDHDLTIQPEEG